MRCRPLLFWLLLVTWIATSGGIHFATAEPSARGTGKRASEEAGRRLVSEALAAESRGDLMTRRQLLDEALRIAPGLDAARWHNGMLPDGRGWSGLDQQVSAALRDSRLQQYARLRDQAGATIEDHWRLARWSVREGLEAQQRAHLEHILLIDPDHLAARQQLGHERVGDHWLTPDQMADLRQSIDRSRRSVGRFGRQVNRLMQQIQSGAPGLQQNARQRLLQIEDSLAAPVVTAAGLAFGESAALAAVDWLAAVDSPHTSTTLAHLAVVHPSAAVRSSAAEALTDRPWFEVVPELLSLLSGQIQLAAVPLPGANGQATATTQALLREGRDEHHVVIGVGPLGRTSVIPLAGGNVIREMGRQNQSISARNQRVADVLSRVTGEYFGGDTRQIWDWWDNYNGNKYQEEKPYRYQFAYTPASFPQQRDPSAAPDCFVAGTPVMTRTGRRPIEQIEPGDEVLSRDLDSGKLAWKPVVAATARAPEPTVQVVLPGGSLTCTPGHLLWVSGRGWTMAGKIQRGDILHGPEEPVEVIEVGAGEVLPTHNLRVLDHHTYFAGHDLVLSHDVTPRTATRVAVPGQSQQVRR